MRKIAIATMFLGLLAGPVYAQQKPVSAMSDDEKVKAAAADTIDRQYRSTLDSTRKAATETRVDPWSNMRGAEAPKAKR